MKNYQRILSTETLQFLTNKAYKSTHYGKHMATYVSVITMVMKTCKGRDKICSVIQYLADFYYNCNKYSEINEVLEQFRNNKNFGAIVALKLRNSMKNSRKIFKFLRFIDQLSAISKTLDSKKPLFLKIFLIFESLMVFFSNLCDNLLWGINIEVLGGHFKLKHKALKANKYFFSLFKIIFRMFSSNYQHHVRIKKMKEILTELKKFRQQPINIKNESYSLCSDYLQQRNQIRIEQIDAAIMMFRLVMLVRKLKLPGYQFVTKILYSACGLISTFLSTYKMIINQPILVEFREKDHEAYDENLEMKFESIQKTKRLHFTRTGSLQFQ